MWNKISKEDLTVPLHLSFSGLVRFTEKKKENRKYT